MSRTRAQDNGMAVHELAVDADRTIVIWESCRGRSEGAPIVLLAAGFGKTMSHSAPLSLYLAHAGFDVIRYDPLNHVGASTGDMEDYTMSSGLDSLTLVAAWVRRRFPSQSIGLVANSISARLAYRLAAVNPLFDYLVTGVGVVHLAATLREALGADYAVMDSVDLPRHAEFENRRFLIGPFRDDGLANRWLDAATCRDELKGSTIPVVAFSAADDRWVDVGEIRSVMEGASHPGSRLRELVGSGHEIGANPAIARAFLTHLTETCVELCGSPRMPGWREPTFREITQQVIQERRTERVVAPTSTI